jgi:aminopeptidase YwaD
MEEWAEKLYQSILRETDRKQIWNDVQTLNQWFRYTGTEEGEASARFIRDRLKSYGIPVEWVQYPCYRSIPNDASLSVEGQDEPISLMPYVYSGATDALQGELAFDELSAQGGGTQAELAGRLERLKGKIALTYDNSYRFSVAAARAGVKALLHIWPKNLAHHGSIGGVWGSPGVDDLEKYPFLPFAEILHDVGEALKKRLETQTVRGTLQICMENDIRRSSMPVAFIQGQSDDFVLVSGHYDGWHEGITDNACANASMIELARILWNHRDSLKRSVMLAWWSGHSDGKYAGSTYYFDTHFEQISKHCVAHVNMDISGCATSDLVAFNTAGMEGAANDLDWLQEFNTEPVQAPIPMDRFADQTFWGADVPFAIMPRFNRRELGDGIFYWWHTREDTLNKVDQDVLYRDHCVIGKLTSIFAMSRRLPFDFSWFLAQMTQRLDELRCQLPAEFTLESVYAGLDKAGSCAAELAEAYAADPSLEKVALEFAGELARLLYTSASRYQQGPAYGKFLLPGLSGAAGCTSENCTAEYYLALKTDFLRQRNRVNDQLERAVRLCRLQLNEYRVSTGT